MEVQVDYFPFDYGEFSDWAENVAKTPQGAVVVFIVALKLYQKTKDLQYVVSSLTGKALNDGEMLKNEKIRLDEQLERYPHLVDAYYLSANPENGYKVAGFPWKVAFKDLSDEDSSKLKVFVKSNGADSDRPATVEKTKEGIWKVSEFSSLLSGVKEPEGS